MTIPDPSDPSQGIIALQAVVDPLAPNDANVGSTMSEHNLGPVITYATGFDNKAEEANI